MRLGYFSAAASGQDAEGVQPGRPIWLRLAAAVASVLLLSFGAWYASFGLRRQAARTPAARIAAPAEISVNVAAAIGDKFSVQPPVLPLAYIDVETEAGVKVDRPGETRIGSSRGEIDIVNDGSAPQTLVATTRLISGEGVMFRLDERVTVPPRGRVTAAMTADQPGPQGDVPAGRFSIPGLATARQRYVYGLTSSPTSGGATNTGAIFNEADLAALRSLIEAEAFKTLGGLIAAKTPEDALTAAEPPEIMDIRFIEVPTVGRPIGAFIASAVVSARTPSVDRKEAEALLLADLASRAEIGAYELGKIEFSMAGDGPERHIVLRSVARLKPR